MYCMYLQIWKRRWIIFKRASSAGPKRLEKFVDEKAAIGGVPHKTILLDTITFVTRLPRENKRHGLVLKFSNSATRQFCCESGRCHDIEVIRGVFEMFVARLWRSRDTWFTECMRILYQFQNIYNLSHHENDRVVSAYSGWRRLSSCAQLVCYLTRSKRNNGIDT